MGKRQVSACGIDDDEIELYALGRVREPDPRLIAHFKACKCCAERMEDARLWAAEIRRFLSEQIEYETALRAAAEKRRT